MPKRVEVDLEPVHPSHFQNMIDIRNSRDTSHLEKQLAGSILEIGCKLNELLLLLHHGMVSISEEPPEPRQFARQPNR
jgi:hypothetical protein